MNSCALPVIVTIKQAKNKQIVLLNMKRIFRGGALRLRSGLCKRCKIIKMCHPDQSGWHK
jgi:hypothetical protein